MTKNENYYNKNTQSECAKNCADTAGCTGYNWKNNDCQLFLMSGSWYTEVTEKDEEVMETGRLTSMCGEPAFDKEFVKKSSFACKFLGDGTSEDFAADLIRDNQLSDLGKNYFVDFKT